MTETVGSFVVVMPVRVCIIIECLVRRYKYVDDFDNNFNYFDCLDDNDVPFSDLWRSDRGI